MCNHSECNTLAFLLGIKEEEDYNSAEDFYGNREIFMEDFKAYLPCFYLPSNSMWLIEMVYRIFGGMDEFIQENSFMTDFLNVIVRGLDEADETTRKVFYKESDKIKWVYDYE